MKSFNLFIDQKYSIWIREYTTVEADSLEEAVKKCINNDYDPEYQEDLWDTAGPLTPEENNGHSTFEVYSPDSDKYDALYTNAEQ